MKTSHQCCWEMEREGDLGPGLVQSGALQPPSSSPATPGTDGTWLQGHSAPDEHAVDGAEAAMPQVAAAPCLHPADTKQRVGEEEGEHRGLAKAMCLCRVLALPCSTAAGSDATIQWQWQDVGCARGQTRAPRGVLAGQALHSRALSAGCPGLGSRPQCCATNAPGCSCRIPVPSCRKLSAHLWWCWLLWLPAGPGRPGAAPTLSSCVPHQQSCPVTFLLHTLPTGVSMCGGERLCLAIDNLRFPGALEIGEDAGLSTAHAGLVAVQCRPLGWECGWSTPGLAPCSAGIAVSGGPSKAGP